MKKYLSIAAILGIIAFASVTFLAQAGAPVAHAKTGATMHAKLAAAVQAEKKTRVMLASADNTADPSDGEAAADEAEAADNAIAAPKGAKKPAGDAAIAPKAQVQDAFDADHDTCAASATTTPGADGKAATTEQIADAYNSCMNAKGHSNDELKAHATATEAEEDTGNGKSTGGDE